MNSKAPYKDFEVDIDKGIDMFSNMSKCLNKKWECDANKRCNEECDECEYMYGCGNTGQIQNLFDNVQEWLTELKKYKQMEEQGMLYKLPCAIGDKVYLIVDNKVVEREVDPMFLGVLWEEFGKSWFLTKNEAKASLKELRGKNE